MHRLVKANGGKEKRKKKKERKEKKGTFSQKRTKKKTEDGPWGVAGWEEAGKPKIAENFGWVKKRRKEGKKEARTDAREEKKRRVCFGKEKEKPQTKEIKKAPHKRRRDNRRKRKRGEPKGRVRFFSPRHTVPPPC